MLVQTRNFTQETPVRVAKAACVLLFGGGGAVSLWGGAFVENNSGPLFYLIIAGLSIYLCWECLTHLRHTDTYGLLAPPFLASVAHFFLVYILPSISALFDPWILDRFAKHFSSQPTQLSDAALLIGVAACCMWRGYGIAQRSAAAIRNRLQAATLMRSKLAVAIVPALALQFAYFSLVVYAISLGVFGMTSSSEARERYIDVLELLNIGIAGGSLSLFLLLTVFYTRRKQGDPALVLGALCASFVCTHVGLGAVSGFKSQIVMPFVMLAFARFVATRELSFRSFALACVALFASYQVIEPFRSYISRNQIQGASDLVTVVEALRLSQEQSEFVHTSDISWGTQVTSRLDLTGMTAVGVAAASNPLIAAKGSDFAESLYLAPLLAFIPRALWTDKQSYTSGVWFSNNVLGQWQDTSTSVGMGPVTWLYITGGVICVMVGFLGLGLVQALVFDGLGRSGAGGFIMFLSIAPQLIMIPTDFGPMLVGMMRILPIAFAAQLILLLPHLPPRRIRHA